MKEIEIDDDVFFYLQSQALAFVETPNMTLRRMFRLDPPVETRVRAVSPENGKLASDPESGDGSNPEFLSDNVETLPIRQDEAGALRRTRQTKTNLRLLISEGCVSEGQRLFLHGYDGHRIPGPEFQATIQGRNLIWAVDRQSYSMSDLATKLLKRLGHQSACVRGPSRWFTGEGRSIQDLWTERVRKGRRPIAPLYPDLSDHIPLAAR